MPGRLNIRIKENGYSQDIIRLTLSFIHADGREEDISLTWQNAADENIDKLLEWYFESYITRPYDDVNADSAAHAIRTYGTKLFDRLFRADKNFEYIYRNALQSPGLQNIVIEIIGSSPAFQAIYWESLFDSEQSDPLAVLGVIISRKNVSYQNIVARVEESPSLNLLVVTSRPYEENDVNYRTIQRPIVELGLSTEVRVRPHILRPGTYEALVRHLDDRAGYYHIIHFDLHGSLLNYEAYNRLRQDQNTYSLGTLKEQDFGEGKKAFLFFESNENGKPVIVEAGQLATMLEHKQVPVCILNACQSAKQAGSASETSLGRALIQRGIQSVLAMRFSVSVSAATIMMKSLYEQLYRQRPLEEGVVNARKELFRNKTRNAGYNYQIQLEDWMLPVLYQNGKTVFSFRPATLIEEEADYQSRSQAEEFRQLADGDFFGRDLDILKIEKCLIVRSNILLVRGMGGSGKTTLLKYLLRWWLQTGFIQYAFYFAYDSKAFTVKDIVYELGKKIYPTSEWPFFVSFSEGQQEQKIADKLNANTMAIVLDNTESITGEQFAIPNTLSEPERAALKKFLQRLKGGKTRIIIGSRSNESWLADDTFENHIHQLSGLDPGASANFADWILKNAGVETSSQVKDEHFQSLMNLLAGFPLAMKAILPTLKRKTSLQILNSLQKDFSGIEPATLDRTKSIVKCIEYAYSNLSPEAKRFMLCLSPFQAAVNFHPDFISLYLSSLKTNPFFADFNVDNFQVFIDEATTNGFLQEQFPGHPMKVMSIQPIFTYFMSNKLNESNAEMRSVIDQAFLAYYNGYCQFTYDVLKPDTVNGIFKDEYQNVYHALALSLKGRYNPAIALSWLDRYLEFRGRKRDGLNLNEMVLRELKNYPAEYLRDQMGPLIGAVSDRIIALLIDLGEIDLAISQTELALKTMDTTPHFFEGLTGMRAGLYNYLGILNSQKHELESAKIFYNEALELYKTAGDLDAQGNIYMNLGSILGEQQKYSEAKKMLNDALEIYSGHNQEREADIHNNLGNICHMQTDYDLASSHYEQALGFYRKLNLLPAISEVFQNIGNVLLDTMRLEEATISYNKALDMAVMIGDQRRQGQLFIQLGSVKERLNHIDEAKRYYERALQFFQRDEDEFHKAHVLVALANTNAIQGNFLAAKNNFETALEISRRKNQHLDIASALQGLANLSLDQGNYEDSGKYFKEALAIFQKLGDQFDEANVLENMARLATVQNKYELAKSLLEECIGILIHFPQDIHIMLFAMDTVRKTAHFSGDEQFAFKVFQHIAGIYNPQQTAELQQRLGIIKLN